MGEKLKELLSDRVILLSAVAVFVVVLVILAVVFSHEKEKPRSPQGLVACAFNQKLSVQEWKPGMGSQPYVYHPPAAGQLAWRPLPSRKVYQQQFGTGGVQIGVNGGW